MAPPLAGIRIVEFAGIGPGPYCAMLLGDLGAEILRIDRPGPRSYANPVTDRGRAALTLDMRTDAGRATAMQAVESADMLIEGFRPGVMERLGLGPEPMLERNPRLIYGRMTGWGQSGPLAHAAGHDINYISLTGALAAIGITDRPAVPPLNLVGDYGGGSLFLAMGLLAALYERERSGRGQVVDAAIVDGAASLMAMFYGMAPAGEISMERDRNFLGGAAPFYRCYRCRDGREISVGPLEPHFYTELLRRIGAPDSLREEQFTAADWPAQSQMLAEIFATKDRADWCTLLEGTDSCFAPVLTWEEAPDHPHMRARDVFVQHNGVAQPAPAPRFSRTPGTIAAAVSGEERLKSWAGDRKT